ncbi:hypothetical protein XELAEV_18027073mg [Xenopus laevis]|uniref:Uncharacterized protein n=1 Tax=Xenopus laevis TaxID=8355 RepID=A0A974CWT2_XENLA|nr:hypothetical protein XELAEV_18027073mg [Xenopus laevis]
MPSKMIAILYAVLILGKEFHAEPIVMPGPSSGIMLQDTAGFIMTNKRILSQKVYMSLDARCVIERQVNVSNIRSPEFQTWYQLHIEYSQERVTQILEQTQKTLTRELFSSNQRPKRFIPAIVAAIIFAVVGTVFATGVTIANSVSLKTMESEIIGWLTVITILAIRWMKFIKETLDKLWLRSCRMSLHDVYNEDRV